MGTLLLFAVVTTAEAGTPIVVRAGNLVLTLNGGPSPRALPKKSLVPISVHISARIASVDGSQPPALEEFDLETGPTGAIEAKGVPVCRAGAIEATNTEQAERACSSAIVGKGDGEVRVAFPEQTPFTARGPLVLFNGGVSGGKTLILIHTYVNVPAPTAIVETVVITKEHRGPYNLRAAARIPKIAGGSGSVTSFDFTINRPGYLLASCLDGEFFAHATATFSDGTDLAGSFVRPCTSIGSG